MLVANTKNGLRDHFLFVGSLIRRKGIDLIIEIAKSNPSLKFKIAGDGSERAWVQKSIAEYGLANQIQLLGPVPNGELPELYAEAIALVLPSRSEGLPLTILEALSCGIPVVASDVGGIGDVITHSKNGFLLKKDDVDAFVSTLVALRNDPELGESLRRNTRSSIERDFRKGL